mgnify:CR=1 FL=1
MTIQQCIYVLEIHNTGSFSEAARKLFVAQSSLSTSVRCLEDELGIKIFERSKNGAVLTVDGAEFVRYAAEIVSKNDFVINRVEYDSELNSYFILGYYRDKETRRASKFFISKLIDKELKEEYFEDIKKFKMVCKRYKVWGIIAVTVSFLLLIFLFI